jgi:hypothetical protein
LPPLPERHALSQFTFPASTGGNALGDRNDMAIGGVESGNGDSPS